MPRAGVFDADQRATTAASRGSGISRRRRSTTTSRRRCSSRSAAWTASQWPLYREVAPLVQFDAKVTAIDQDEHGVSVTYVDARRGGATDAEPAPTGACARSRCRSCRRFRIKVGEPMQAAIGAVAYEASVKIGLQMKRRFWEEDERIYGGITLYRPADPADRLSDGRHEPARQGRVARRLHVRRERVRIHFDDAASSACTRRSNRARRSIRNIATEFENGIASPGIARRSRWAVLPNWPDDAPRKALRQSLCQIDGRIALAGEHASFMPGWQEGAVLSSLDAISRMHARVAA